MIALPLEGGRDRLGALPEQRLALELVFDGGLVVARAQHRVKDFAGAAQDGEQTWHQTHAPGRDIRDTDTDAEIRTDVPGVPLQGPYWSHAFWLSRHCAETNEPSEGGRGAEEKACLLARTVLRPS